MAAFSTRSHAGRASAPWFGAAGRRTVVSGRRGDGGVGAGRRWRQERRSGKGIAGEGEGERGDRYEVGAHNTNGAPPLGAP